MILDEAFLKFLDQPAAEGELTPQEERTLLWMAVLTQRVPDGMQGQILRFLESLGVKPGMSRAEIEAELQRQWRDSQLDRGILEPWVEQLARRRLAELEAPPREALLPH